MHITKKITAVLQSEAVGWKNKEMVGSAALLSIDICDPVSCTGESRYPNFRDNLRIWTQKMV
jgi:hypothetical protein